MSPTVPGSSTDALLDPGRYAAELAAWLDERPTLVKECAAPLPNGGERVEANRSLMAELHADGWSRYGWPVECGGLGGSIMLRAAMWEVVSRYGLPCMAAFEHLEILAPTLAEYGSPEFAAAVLPEFLAGRELWAQGFSEPDAGSDLASLRTVAVPDGDGFRISGTKVWTSWASYATWCLVLARTGTPESRHRGLTAFVVDLRSPGVEVRTIRQANGTDELAEVFFDDVVVGPESVLGDIGGGWKIAMHILSHERGTYAWFRHCFLVQHLGDALVLGGPHSDAALGNVVLDLAAVAAASYAGLRAHAASTPLGPMSAFTKLLLCAAEQSTYDWILANDPEVAIGVQTDEVAVRRQEYLFSRIVTVYGGSQQMQLDTIAKQILRLP